MNEKNDEGRYDRDLIDRLSAQDWRGVQSTLFRLTKSQAERLQAALSPSEQPEPVALPETLDWLKVDGGALFHERASFGDYVLDVTLGHDQIWAYRVNNTGRLHFDGEASAKAAAMEDLRGRLSIRWAAAQKTLLLYAQPSKQTGGGGVVIPRDLAEAAVDAFRNDCRDARADEMESCLSTNEVG